MWIFGYGSLIWKPEPNTLEVREGYVQGWGRRFYQGSPDHRGTVAAPGRVLTLVPDERGAVWGRAYRIGPDDAEAFLADLNVREQAGYTQHWLPVFDERAGAQPAIERALVYIGEEGNPDYLGPATPEEIARHVVRSRGPSGPNDEYVLSLDDALVDAGIVDEHVGEVARHVRALLFQKRG